MQDLSSLKKKTEKNEKKKVVAKAQKNAKKKTRNKKIAIISLAVLLIVLFLAWGVYQWGLNYYLEKINIVTEETGLIFETEHLETEEVKLNGEMNNDNLPLVCDTKNVKNILLLAVDSRGKEAGLSDSMMLLSINRKTDKIVLCSFLRDIWARFPQEPKSPVAGKYSKLNHAHSYGGPELTMAVLKETFNIEVDYYAKINFYSFIDMIDIMGGVDVEMTSSEIWWINDHFLTERTETHELFPDYPKTLIPGGEGVKHLNGLQALGHARNRAIGSDFARTERQRDILQAMAKKATTLSLSQLNQLLNSVLPMITTNMPKNMIKDFIGDIPSYLTYDVESTRIPEDGLYTSQNYNIIPDLEKNCNLLYEKIYGEKPKINK